MACSCTRRSVNVRRQPYRRSSNLRKCCAAPSPVCCIPRSRCVGGVRGGRDQGTRVQALDGWNLAPGISSLRPGTSSHPGTWNQVPVHTIILVPMLIPPLPTQRLAHHLHVLCMPAVWHDDDHYTPPSLATRPCRTRSLTWWWSMRQLRPWRLPHGVRCSKPRVLCWLGTTCSCRPQSSATRRHARWVGSGGRQGWRRVTRGWWGRHAVK